MAIKKFQTCTAAPKPVPALQTCFICSLSDYCTNKHDNNWAEVAHSTLKGLCFYSVSTQAAWRDKSTLSLGRGDISNRMCLDESGGIRQVVLPWLLLCVGVLFIVCWGWVHVHCQKLACSLAFVKDGRQWPGVPSFHISGFLCHFWSPIQLRNFLKTSTNAI